MTLALRLIGISSAVSILIFVIILIRRKKLTDEFATLWLITSFIFLTGSVFSKEIFLIYKYLKGASGGGLDILLFISIIMIIFLMIILSSKLSDHQSKLKTVVQTLAILENKLRSLNKDES